MPRLDSRTQASLATALLLAIAAVTPLAGCARKAPPRSNRVAVTVATVERRPMPVALKATGTVEPVQTADVGSQVGGVITRIAFREGDMVRAGQPLFELDARPFRAALLQAQGVMARDRAQLRTAQLNEDRAASLFHQNLLAQSDWDAARSTADGLRGTVEADSAAVVSARLNFDYATIRSPIAGRAGRFMLHVGDYVKSATSEPLVTVNQMRPINVRFTVSESDRPSVEKYRSGNPRVLVRTTGADSTEVAGRLSFVDNSIDPATGTLTLKGEFPNADGRLWPGEFVEVRLVLTVDPNALVVPFPAISNGQQGTYVYVVNADSSATMRLVKVARSDDATAVIASGLKPGETVVTDGQFRISPGARLVIRDPGAAQHAGAAGSGKGAARR
jgi:membrane fusion protein, multidrug efflux system